jgi:AP-1-like factor
MPIPVLFLLPQPTSVDPKQKRKAQNRAAQRAFRERKEKYVKELEDRIAELEATQKNSQDNASAVLEKENQQLKELVQKLEAENYLLKGTAFTFDFPISKANISKNTSALVPDAGVQPSTLLRNDGVVPSTTDAWTPPSSAHDDSGSEPSSPSGLTNSPNTNKSTDPSPASDSLNGVPGFSSNNSLTSFGDLSAGNLDSFFDNSAAFDTTAADRFMANHVPHKSSDEISNSSLFNQYRTPANAIENSTFSETPMPPLFENEFDDYNSFAPLLTPKEESLRETEFFDIDNIGKVHQAPDLKNPDAHLNPMQAWELLQQHPQFEELEIDDLCNEMKNKATCTERTLTGEELQKVLEKKLYKN